MSDKNKVRALIKKTQHVADARDAAYRREAAKDAAEQESTVEGAMLALSILLAGYPKGRRS